MRLLPHRLPIEHLQRRLRMLDCGGCFANGVKGTNGLRLAGARLRMLRGVKPAVLAILHLLAMFVADLFKPRQLEVKNLFLRHQLNIADRLSLGRERDPIPYALETDWPVGAAGVELPHLE